MAAGFSLFGSEVIPKMLPFPVIAHSARKPGVHEKGSQDIEHEIILRLPFTNGRKST